MDITKPSGDRSLSVLLKTFMNKRQVLSLENEARGVTDVDHDRTRERAFCSPGLLQEIISDAATGTRTNRDPR